MKVVEIQNRLNELGFGPIPPTGHYGRITTAAVARFQRSRGLLDDGIAGPITMAALFEDDPSKRFVWISQAAVDLIIESEITSESVYNRRYQRPIYPGQQSGVTIGIGYDLGYNDEAQIREDWSDLVNAVTLRRLLSASGIKGASAQNKILRMQDILIPFDAAKQVFLERTLPRYTDMALRAYPGLDKLRPSALGAIVSLVFNRGTSFRGSTRMEMAALAPVIFQQNYQRMADLVLAMRRLWDGVSENGNIESRVPGLIRRREREASLILHINTTSLVKIYL
jgi:GH24 family phage-related lysozyme (muramidase)